MDRQLETLQNSRTKISSVCKILKYVFYALFALYCVASAAIIGLMLLQPGGFTPVGTSDPVLVISVICDVVACGLVLLTMGHLLGCMSKGESPFTPSSSKLLIVLGLLILASTVCKSFIAPGANLGAMSGDTEAVFSYPDYGDDSIYIDTRGILETIACFVLAVIFRYGALLQKESDDLV